MVAGVVFLALDALWLETTAARLYRPAIGHLTREGFDLRAAALFYVFYIAGMTSFALAAARGTGSAAARGGWFGLVVYAAYDFTNQATMRDWPWHLTAIDLCWGGVATMIACAIGYRAARMTSAAQ